MAVSYTYNVLVAELKNWTENASDEYDSAIPNIIASAELRILKDLDLEYFDVTEDVTMTGSDPLLAKPEDTIIETEIYLPSGARLKKRTRSYLMDYAPDDNETGTPIYYCDESDESWRLAPVPDSSGTVKARVRKRPDGLTEANQTTWISTRVGDALFKACMIESEEFMKTDIGEEGETGRIAMFKSEYQNAIVRAGVELVRARAMGYVPMKPNQGGVST